MKTNFFRKIIIYLLMINILVAIITSCNFDNSNKAINNAVSKKEVLSMEDNESANSAIKSNLEFSDFDFLKIGQSRNFIIKKVGKPSDRIGSGILSDRYYLSDGSRMILNYGIGGDTLSVVTYVKKDGTYKDILIASSSK